MDSNSSQPRTSRIGGLEQLGKYELVCVLARSDLGSLWASVVTYGEGVGELMAVQRIVVRPGDEGTLTEPIKEVADALKGLRRPGVIPVVDCVVSPGRLGVVSEYVEGEPLRSLQNLASLKKAPITSGVAIRLGLDILEALVEFHGLAAENEALTKYVHGGLSPDTVVVTAKGKAQLLNPGLAAVASSLPALSWHTAALAYRAPEHLGSGNPVDARTDVFVAGVILWELLAQRQLFHPKGGATPSEPPRSSKRGNEVAMAQQVLTATIERLDAMQLATPVSKELADVIDKALQRDPAARYGSAREMAEALAIATKDLAAPTAHVAEMVEALASSTLITRRSAIARAGVEIAPVSRPARAVASEDEAFFGSDWVTDADSGVDDKIHALSAGALAMTPTPSAAIAVGPKPSVAIKTAAGAPRPPVGARTPAPGIVRPKPPTPATKPAAATPKAPAAKPVAPSKFAGGKLTPSPAPAKAAQDEDFGIDVELPDEGEAADVVPDSGKTAEKGPPSRRPPPPPAAAKSETPAPPEAKPTAEEAPAPAPVEVPPPPKELVDSANAFMSGTGDDAFAAGGADAFADAAEPKPEAEASDEAPAAEGAMWKPPESAAAEAPAEQAQQPAEVESATRQTPPPASEPAQPPAAVDADADADFDERLAAAAQRRRKGYLVMGVVGGLAALVGLFAIVHAATKDSPADTTAATATAPTPPPVTTTAASTATAPEATTTAEPTPSESAEPPPAESVASAEPPPPPPTATAPAATTPKPPKPGTGAPKPPKPKPPKPYTPSGI